MELKFVEENRGMSSPKRDSRLSICRNQKVSMKCNLLESIAQKHGGVVSHTKEDGVVRVKILVKKQDLKNMLQMMGNGKENNNTNQRSSIQLDQRLLVLKKRQLKRAQPVKGNCRTWRPALQSIPEDL